MGVHRERPVCRGEKCMSTPTRSPCLSSWFVCILLVCIAATNVWSDTDKTEVDLERGRPEAASRYHRPRAAHLYQYDKTVVDLAGPLVQPSPEEPRAPQRPGTLTPAAPAPTPPPPQAPLPGGGRGRVGATGPMLPLRRHAGSAPGRVGVSARPRHHHSASLQQSPPPERRWPSGYRPFPRPARRGARWYCTAYPCSSCL